MADAQFYPVAREEARDAANAMLDGRKLRARVIVEDATTGAQLIDYPLDRTFARGDTVSLEFTAEFTINGG